MEWSTNNVIRLGVAREALGNASSVKLLEERDCYTLDAVVEFLNKDRTSRSPAYKDNCYLVYSQPLYDHVLLFRANKNSDAQDKYAEILQNLGRTERRAVQLMEPFVENGERKLQVAVAGITEVAHQLRQVATAERVNKVAIVSVMGQMRQGKSFLLNCLSRYFEWLEKEQKDKGNKWKPRSRDNSYKFTDDEGAGSTSEPWLDDLERESDKEKRKIKAYFEILRGDDKACTEGIWCLTKPFVVMNPNSKHRCMVLILDSQGSFDPRKDPKVSTSILAVTAVLASSLISNTMHFGVSTINNFDELNNLMEHQVSLQTDALGQETNETNRKAFGSLVFLIRDKQFDFEVDDADPMSFDDCATQVKNFTDTMLDASKIAEENAVLRPVALRLHRNFESIRSWGIVTPEKKVVRNASLDPKDFGVHFKKLLGEFFRSEFEAPGADFPRPSRHCLSGEELTTRNFQESVTSVCGAFADCDPRVGVPELAVQLIAKRTLEHFRTKVRMDIKPCTYAKFPKSALFALRDAQIAWFKHEVQDRFAELADREDLLDVQKMNQAISQEEALFDKDKMRTTATLTAFGAVGVVSAGVCGVSGLYTTVFHFIAIAPWSLPIVVCGGTCCAYSNHARRQKQIKQFRVVKVVGDNVYSDMQITNAVGLKKLDEMVWGRSRGDWIELIDEPHNFMLCQNNEAVYLLAVKEGQNPWDPRVWKSFTHVTFKKTYWCLQGFWSTMNNVANAGKTVLGVTRARAAVI